MKTPGEYHSANAMYRVTSGQHEDATEPEYWTAMCGLEDVDGSVRLIDSRGPFKTAEEAQQALRAMIDERYPQ